MEFFFWKYFLGHTTFSYSSISSRGHHQSFFDFRFSSRKSQSQQKLTKKVTHFTIQFRSKHLTHFTELNSLDIENNLLPKYSLEPFSLYKFSSKLVFCVVSEKNICTAPFLDTQELHPWNTFKANVCISLWYISHEKIFYLG